MAAFAGDLSLWGWPGSSKGSLRKPSWPPKPASFSMSSLGSQIYELSEKTEQSCLVLQQKMELRNKLVRAFELHFKKPVNLYIVGSSITGICAEKCDVDMSLITMDYDQNQSCLVINSLTEIRAMLSSNYPHLIKSPEIIRAKVGLLRFESLDGLKVDLTLNSTNSIRSTHLVSCYVSLDARVRPLVVAVKLWAKKYNINYAFQNGLSSYSLTLMVINYLQCRSPSVLPCLQQLEPYAFERSANVKNISLSEPRVDYMSSNTETIDQLLIGFFNHYGHEVDLTRFVISVRQGRKIEKDTFRMSNPGYYSKKWQYVCIEEPFDRTNTAASVFWQAHHTKILSAFRDAHSKLTLTKDLYLICLKEC